MSITNKEKKELKALTKRLTKKDGEPRKNASKRDMDRLDKLVNKSARADVAAKLADDTAGSDKPKAKVKPRKEPIHRYDVDKLTKLKGFEYLGTLGRTDYLRSKTEACTITEGKVRKVGNKFAPECLARLGVE